MMNKPMIDAPGSNRTAKPKGERILTGRAVLLSLIAFFGVVFSVNAVMITLAIETLPGTDVDSAYKESLAYNSVIKAAHAQAERAWRVDAHLDRDPSGRAAVKVQFRDSAGVPQSGLAVSVRLSRPTDKRADRVIDVREPEAGLYRGEAFDIPPGQWELVVLADRGEQRVFESRNRMTLN